MSKSAETKMEEEKRQLEEIEKLPRTRENMIKKAELEWGIIAYEEYLEFMYNHEEHKSFNFDTYQKIRDELYVNGSMDSKKYFDALYVHKGEEEIRKHFFVELYDFLPKEIYKIADSELSLYFKKESFYILKEKSII